MIGFKFLSDAAATHAEVEVFLNQCFWFRCDVFELLILLGQLHTSWQLHKLSCVNQLRADLC